MAFKKRLLTVGYSITQIEGITNVSYSNYSLSFSSDKRWANKIEAIKSKIDNNELQCIIIVVSRQLIEEINSLGNERFKKFLEQCKRTNCFIAIQEFLQEDEPLYYDYLEDRKLTIKELEERVKEYSTQDRTVDNSLNTSTSDFDEFDNSEDIDSHRLRTEHSEYSRKLELLKDTEEILPKAKEIITLLKSEFEDYMVFRYLSQVYGYIKDELVERFSNEILNIYIPRQYGYKLEFDDFIQVFEKYLKGVEQLNISVEINETSTGVNYKFVSNDLIESISDLPNKFQRFKSFIDICEKEPEEALRLLETKNIPSEQALEIIQRLSKKYKRLILDIQQQQERLELAYKQEIQSELLEVGSSDTPFSLVQKSFSVQALDSIYEPNTNEEQLIKLVKKYSEDVDVTNLKSDLGIVKDKEIKPDDRKRSAYKLKKVLGKLADKGLESVEKIAIETLKSYVNGQIGS